MEQINSYFSTKTIAAIATPAGSGGIAVIRISGPESIKIVNEAWKGIDLNNVPSHSAHLGKYFAVDGTLLDEVLLTLFRNPKSYTGEDVVEISVHGSPWIQKEVLNDLVRRGVSIAAPGEFTQRAFLNGRLDLAQAEGIADLIASASKASHDLAISQTKGTFSREFKNLRDQLIEFASLLELELDFSEEDVNFAERDKLSVLCKKIIDKIESLASSFSKGEVIKNGVPVVIAGIPNAGKSSLLNLLLGEDKAIVTDLPGTTRDTIEDTIEINGIIYRFIDTAGLRDTNDRVEAIGVNRAKENIKKAHVVIWVIDSQQGFDKQLQKLQEFRKEEKTKPIIILINKTDLPNSQNNIDDLNLENSTFLSFSTITKSGLDELKGILNKIVKADINPEKDIIITNARHFEALTKASESLRRALEGLRDGISSDFIAQDIREATSHLASLTGTITSDTLLHSIFSRFCIGK